MVVLQPPVKQVRRRVVLRREPRRVEHRARVLREVRRRRLSHNRTVVEPAPQVREVCVPREVVQVVAAEQVQERAGAPPPAAGCGGSERTGQEQRERDASSPPAEPTRVGPARLVVPPPRASPERADGSRAPAAPRAVAVGRSPDPSARGGTERSGADHRATIPTPPRFTEWLAGRTAPGRTHRPWPVGSGGSGLASRTPTPDVDRAAFRRGAPPGPHDGPCFELPKTRRSPPSADPLVAVLHARRRPVQGPLRPRAARARRRVDRSAWRGRRGGTRGPDERSATGGLLSRPGKEKEPALVHAPPRAPPVPVTPRVPSSAARTS